MGCWPCPKQHLETGRTAWTARARTYHLETVEPRLVAWDGRRGGKASDVEEGGQGYQATPHPPTIITYRLDLTKTLDP